MQLQLFCRGLEVNTNTINVKTNLHIIIDKPLHSSSTHGLNITRKAHPDRVRDSVAGKHSIRVKPAPHRFRDERPAIRHFCTTTHNQQLCTPNILHTSLALSYFKCAFIVIQIINSRVTLLIHTPL